jgi:selenocysteine lyase/cysteine desulfurase
MPGPAIARPAEGKVNVPARPDAAPPTVRSWEAYRSEFPIFERVTYLNSCSLGALGARVREAAARFLDLWSAWGASAWYGPWWEELAQLRASVARLLGSDPEDIALHPSISGALAGVASCFEYRARPRVVVAEIDFPTVAYQWLGRQAQGVEVVFARSPDGLTVPLEEFERLVDERTQLVATSHVYFQSGAVQDIAALARIAHARGALLLVDAYQSAGQVPLDVREADVDFLVTGGLKWLLGGPGIAYLYVRSELLPRLRPGVTGWFAHRDQFAFDTRRLEYAADARRLEAGTPSVAAVYAGRAGLSYVHEVGPARIRTRQVELVCALVHGLRELGLEPRVPGRAEDLAGIVTVPAPDPPAAVAALRADRIIVDARPGVVRLSPYFYNTVEDIDRTLAALRRLLR